ncbi:hypothetical protein D3C86_1151480 [compost metagenome]
MSIAKSVRDSCAMCQKPPSTQRGILVVMMATPMTASKGTAARRVRRPKQTRSPQVTSKQPTIGASSSGAGRPILAKRPTPSASGKRNFWIPSDRKTSPTMSRMRRVGPGASRIGRAYSPPRRQNGRQNRPSPVISLDTSDEAPSRLTRRLAGSR